MKSFQCVMAYVLCPYHLLSGPAIRPITSVISASSLVFSTYAAALLVYIFLYLHICPPINPLRGSGDAIAAQPPPLILAEGSTGLSSPTPPHSCPLPHHLTTSIWLTTSLSLQHESGAAAQAATTHADPRACPVHTQDQAALFPLVPLRLLAI
jgi:hypothetical protein